MPPIVRLILLLSLSGMGCNDTPSSIDPADLSDRGVERDAAGPDGSIELDGGEPLPDARALTDAAVTPDIAPAADATMPDARLVGDAARPLDAGPDEDAAPPPDAGAEPLDTAEARAWAAVVLSTCTGERAPSILHDLIYKKGAEGEPLAADPDEVICLARAGSGCAAMAECMGLTFDLRGPCEDQCEGQVAMQCDDFLRVRHDCDRRGLACNPRFGRCESPSFGDCDPADFDERCVDGRPLACQSWQQQGPDCAAHGLTCALQGFSPERRDSPTCMGTGEPCPFDSFSSFSADLGENDLGCEGEALVACVNGAVSHQDCAGLIDDSTCRTVEGQSFCGLDDACRPGAPTACDGDAVTLCNAGRIERVECAWLGFEGCRQGRCVR